MWIYTICKIYAYPQVTKMSLNESNKRISVQLTEEENDRLLSAWKKAEGIRNCTQYVKAAINAYAGEDIFKTKVKTE